jgi:Flp pilus assembly protein TadG
MTRDWRRRRGRGPGRDDRGFVTVWTVAISATFFLIIGFTLDAGRIVRARSDAFGTAAAAARIGANQIDEEEAVLGNGLVLDTEAAEREAEAYVQERGYEGEAHAVGLVVTVTVTAEVVPHMPAVGTQHMEITATAQAIQVAG